MHLIHQAANGLGYLLAKQVEERARFGLGCGVIIVALLLRRFAVLCDLGLDQTLTPAATRLTKGQVQEQKDKQAEVDLESLYKKGRLVDNKKRALPAKQRVQQSKAVVLPARPLQSSKDVEAMRDLEKMHKLGLLQQHGAELRIGNNKMLQLFGKNAASQYSHDQGLLQNKELMQNVHDNTAHAQLKMTTEGAALAATANNFYSKWSNSI